MASKGKLYVVTMYRWGNRQAHSYVLGVFTSKHRAVAMGVDEAIWRGGKYEPEVLETDANPPRDALRSVSMAHLKCVHDLPDIHPLSGLPMIQHRIKHPS